MPVDKKFFEEMIFAAKREQEVHRANFLKQDGVIAFCEMLIKKIEEEEKSGVRNNV